jgi:predicted permease
MSAWRWLLRRRAIERDLDDEIRGHLRMAIDDRIAAGEDPESARLTAMKEFGNVLQTVESTRDVWRGRGIAMLVDLWQDVRFGGRMLIKNPAFSLTVMTVLALGIAGNVTVFTMFKGLALDPLPGVTASSDLAVVLNRTPTGRVISVSIPDFRYFQQHSQSFANLTASAMLFATVGRGTDSQRVAAELVSGNYFEAFAVGAQIGRVLSPSDDVVPGGHPVVVISDALWQTRYGRSLDVIGETLHLNGQPFTIVGVTDRAFNGSIVSIGIDVFIPLMMQPQLMPPSRLDSRGVMMMNTLGHLRPGVTIDAAAAEMRVLAEQLDADNPVPNTNHRATVVPIWQSPHGAQTYWLPAILLLGAMGLLILLVVCANIANLVLVRGLGRRGELAVRVALGASRARIMRLLFVENLALALPGALAGCAIASFILPALLTRAAAVAPARAHLDLTIDRYVVLFALVVAGGCALVFGFVPALRTSRVSLVSVMSDTSPRLAPGGGIRAALVISQVALSLVLLIGAGLVLRSYQSARHAEGGFIAAGVTALSVDLTSGGYDEARGRVLIDRILNELKAAPNVASVSLASSVPLSMVDGPSRAVVIEGYEPRTNDDMSFLYNLVSEDYFATLRIPLASGREFETTDTVASSPVVIINHTLATRMWGSAAAAVGKRLRSGNEPFRTIVGVAEDVKYSRLTEAPRPYVYFPLRQSYTSQITIHARGAAEAAETLRQTRERIKAIDPLLPIARSLTLAEQARQALSVYQMAAGALIMFGVITISLAAIGIYGLIAYTVKESTHEIGIRMAVGASRAAVAWTFVKRGAFLAGAGASIGVLLALAVNGVLQSLLYGVSPRDAVSFAVAITLVVLVAVAASAVPAWRAAMTDPLAALRRH